MEFFFPAGDGPEWTPEEAERHWQACRKGAEGDMGREALARRVYRLDWRHNGQEHSVRVGELDPYEKQPVMAIIAFPEGLYVICCLVRGFLKVGEPIIVGKEEVRYAEDFD